ncbi:acyl-ACP--UDP-N-acetylglucosamine O-acyltransferase [Acaryochloris sp. IP29b_bin.148]|uniref:acyl-ACP--UDP-N-acetylglucosamine O-acyltransferase n=1 Tax=Acaryochloris sp. IP29b_bin.148 TaxID=2969218 RepID=UPI002623A75F|nr:acyl-ACP--UDP-N-acetylglucosamine O-acyltransferase [Acaryochloris sp. IP29b_bin.148]
MTDLIHPTAVIHPGANLHKTVHIGAYVVIGQQVTLGPRTRVGHHAVIEGWAEIGADNHIFPGVVIGMEPQDRNYRGEPSGVKICDRNQIREYVTIHRASGDQQFTCIGSDNLLMANVHIGHNCQIADQVVMANAVALSGHVQVESQANISGVLGIHQFVHIGQLAMIGGMSRIIRDVPPLMLVEGNPAQVRALNQVGLRRYGIYDLLQGEMRSILKQTFRYLYRSGLKLEEALAQVESLSDHPLVQHLCQFMRAAQSRRGLTPGRQRWSAV